MNAPEPLAPPAGALTIPKLPINQIDASATNRTHSQDYIDELAASIKIHGVIQPITVRPWPAARPAEDGVLYEIVIGEGRWLAAAQAGLTEIPAFWRELDDEHAFELQLIENLKRKDLTAIEEAEGYRRLMKDHGHTAESVAAQIGKSKGYIYGRLKLLDLCPAARKYFTEGKLDASTALLVARIPTSALQEKAAKEISEPRWSEDPMSYRAAAEHVQSHYMLSLAKAPFSRSDDALIASAGRCHECPKRTGNQADLFTDVKNADMCTDPGCYEAKTAAHAKKQREAAKAEGVKVIDGAEAKKIKPNSYQEDLAGGYVDLDKKVWKDGKYKSVRELLGKDAPKPEVMIVDPHDKHHTIEAVTKETVAAKLEAKGIKVQDILPSRGSKSDAEKEAERKRKQDATFRQRLFDRIRSQLTIDFAAADADTNLQLYEYQMVAERFFQCLQFEEQKRLARLWIGPTDEKQDDHALVSQLRKNIAQMARGDVCRLLIEAALVGEVSVPTYGDRKPEKMLAQAQGMEIDTAAIKKTIIAETREKEKKKPSAKAKVQPKTAKTAPSEALAKGDAEGKKGPDPSEAAQAGGLGANPAAPAEGKVTKPKATKAKAKADRAATPSPNEPASPANEPAAPVKTAAPKQAPAVWPFPTRA